MTRIVYILLLTLLPAMSYAQPGEVKTEKINGKEYYIHEVESGNTLYGLHQMYNVPIQVIIDSNPGIEDGLQVGQEVKIPVKVENQASRLRSMTESPDSNVVRHTVERGETVFGISRKYNVKAKDILEANPKAEEGINPGDVLIIPVEPGEQLATDTPGDKPQKTIPDTSKVKQKIMLEDSLITHIVQRRETLYSLSKRYMVSQEELKVVNDGLPAGLRKGDTILIPLKRVTMKDVLVKKIRPVDDTLPRDTIPAVVFKDIYEVAVFLPLFLDENQKREEKRMAYEEKEIFGPTRIAVDFYKGVQLAIDSLTNAGISVNLHVFDTEKDTVKIQKILDSEEMQNIDLIMGPFYTASIRPVAQWAKENQVHMVVPVPQSNKMLFKNPYVSKVIPSASSRIQAMAKYVAEKHHDHNIILVDSKVSDDEYLYKLFRSTLDSALQEYPDRKGKVHESFVEKYKLNDLTAKVSGEDTNVVVAPSKEISFVSNLMTRMNRLANSHGHYDTYFEVYGLEEWERFKSVDIIYKHKLNLHIAATKHVDYDTVRTQNLIKSFRSDFGTDPGQFGFMGFDVAYTYIAALSHYGSGLPYKVGTIRSEGVHTRFHLQQVENDSGFENKSVYILEHEDFDLIRKN